MKPIKLSIRIEAFDESKINCYIFNGTENNRLDYYLENENILLKKKNHLATIIHTNQHQFKKVIRSASKGIIRIGQIINCVFIEDFNFLEDKDFNRFIQVDRRNMQLDISASDWGTNKIHKIYADGSYVTETRQSGYGGFTEDLEGKQEVFSRSYDDGSSNLMELLAVIDGLQRLQTINKLQVNTDSRYVIRGLVQWVHFWKHNNWQTAYGRDVKYANYWQEAYELCENKIVEFNWIKGHSGNIAQDFCHQLAKKSSSR